MEVTEIALIQKNLWPSETGYKGYMPVLIEIYHLQFNDLWNIVKGYIWVTFRLSCNLAEGCFVDLDSPLKSMT